MSTPHGNAPSAGRQPTQQQFDRERTCEPSQLVSGKAGGLHRTSGRGACTEARTGTSILR
jgi:hypothetical protein